MKKLSKKRLDKWLKSLDGLRGILKPRWIFRLNTHTDEIVLLPTIKIKNYGCTRDRDFSCFKGVCFEWLIWCIDIGRGI
jgi:hypothetical protein